MFANFGGREAVESFIYNFEKSTHDANGGCLGMEDQGRTYTTTIVVGELSRSFDPAVSEWSNPPDLTSGIFLQNPARGIRLKKGTGRTETSK